MENQLDLDSGCRQIKGTLILNIRRYRKHSGLRAHTTAMGGSRDGPMALGAVHLNNFTLNEKLKKYVKDGRTEKAMQVFQQMQ